MTGFSDMARRYSELGWAVIRADGKRPKGTGWEKTKPIEPNAAAGMWEHWGDRFNIGVVCGPSGLAVIDVDIDENPEVALLELLGVEDLPLTPIVRTGRGRLQAYFADPGGTQKVVRDDVELRVGPHQCIAPPSVHPDTGRSYIWLVGHEPWTVPVAPLPARVVEHFQAQNGHRSGAAAVVGAIIPVGAIDTTLASLAGTMRRRGMSEDAICAALAVELDRCEPGHTHTTEDCRRIARSVSRYSPGEPCPTSDTVGTRSVSSPSEAGKSGTVSPCPVRSRDTVFGDTVPYAPDGLVESLEFEDASAFASEDEDGADPLVGAGDDILIAEDDDVMMYGDGGAGKTTLANDLAVHLAAGADWLGIPVGRPVRVGLIENEGPRPLFRQKLQRKLAGWNGPPLDGRLKTLKRPWGKVSLDDPAVRDQLAAQIVEHELDVVIIGPVTRSGMNEAGTLQHVRDFLSLFQDVRALAGRRVTFVLIHHENRAGAPSGAWEGAVSTLFHVQAQGNGQTRLHVQKARWGGKYHKQTFQLAWADAEGFEVLEGEERDDNAVADEILAFVLENGGTGWVKVEQAVPGNGDRLRSIRDNLIAGGRLVDAGTGVKGTPMKLWHADDPALPASAMSLGIEQ